MGVIVGVGVGEGSGVAVFVMVWLGNGDTVGVSVEGALGVATGVKVEAPVGLGISAFVGDRPGVTALLVTDRKALCVDSDAAPLGASTVADNLQAAAAHNRMKLSDSRNLRVR